MSAQTANLFLLQDLDDSSRTKSLADRDLSALRSVANWIRTFVSRPHEALGRPGPVCPFVPQACERKTLWLASEHIANQTAADIVQLLSGYRTLLLQAQPTAGDDAAYKSIVIVFSDASADLAKDRLDDPRIQQLKRQSYAEAGVVIGEFHARNEGSAIRNSSFRPFQSPVPFLLMRQAVVSDWMFFLDNEDWLGLWARRFGESGVMALAEKLRSTNWRRLESH